MSGETNLQQLLDNMSPELLPQPFIFFSVKAMSWIDIGRLKPKSVFLESEGISLILEQNVADQHNLDYDGIYRCITLNVHSSLEAVGLTAAFSAALTEYQISANVVAGFYHDHIFVNNNDAQRAWQVLAALSSAQ